MERIRIWRRRGRERERKTIEEMAEGENRRGRKRREAKDLEGREEQVRPDDMRKRSI